MNNISIVEAEKICDQLTELAGSAPGEDTSKLNQANTLLREVETRAAGYDKFLAVKVKLNLVRGSFTVWFSPRKWNKFGDSGQSAQLYLLQDIEKLRHACQESIPASN